MSKPPTLAPRFLPPFRPMQSAGSFSVLQLGRGWEMICYQTMVLALRSQATGLSSVPWEFSGVRPMPTDTCPIKLVAWQISEMDSNKHGGFLLILQVLTPLKVSFCSNVKYWCIYGKQGDPKREGERDRYLFWIFFFFFSAVDTQLG